VAAEDNELGIVSIEIDRSSPIADVVIRGLGSEGQQLATTTLRAGAVEYDGAMAPHGRDIVISAGGETYRHSSPDLLGHDAIDPPVKAMVSWLHLHAVADAIYEESGVRFTPREITPASRASLSAAPAGPAPRACSSSAEPHSW